MMSIKEYKRLRDAYEFMEHLEIYQTVKARDTTPMSTYLSHEDMLRQFFLVPTVPVGSASLQRRGYLAFFDAQIVDNNRRFVMPTIAMFYGILIKMYFDDHHPPHFHAEYGEYELLVSISPIKILQGKAPNRVKSMILEWAALHQEELLHDWELCKNMQTPEPIEPLE